jgi:3-methylcrotonyl-CoA carboxylase beta subunit
MTVIQSKVSTASQAFRDNAARMEAQIAETAAVAELHGQGGPQASRERHVGRGKLLPRERVARSSIRIRRFSRSAALPRTGFMAGT